MTNEELVKLLQELSGGMTCGKHVIELEQAADRIELETGPMAEVTEADRNLFIHLTSADDETASRIRRGLIYTWEVRQIARHRQQATEALTAALEKFDDLIQYQYTGSREAMSAMAEAAQEGARVLGRGAWKEAGQPWLWTYDAHLKEKKP